MLIRNIEPIKIVKILFLIVLQMVRVVWMYQIHVKNILGMKIHVQNTKVIIIKSHVFMIQLPLNVVQKHVMIINQLKINKIVIKL